MASLACEGQRARFEPVESETLPAARGVRCVQKNTFLHFEPDNSPQRRPRCMSDVTQLQTSRKRQEEEEEEDERRSNSTVHEDTPEEGYRSRLESMEEWPGQETPQFTGFLGLTQAPPALQLPSAAAGLQFPSAAPRRKKEAAIRTDVTLMLRNIPNKYVQDVLLEELTPHLQSVDFFYLPIDFRNQCNLGYAFLNFKDGAAAQQFQAAFDGCRLARYPQSPKVLQVHPARVQGLQANVKRLRNSSVMGMLTDDCKPVLFDGGAMKPLAHGPPANSRRGRTRAR